MTGRPPQQRANPRQHFFEMEWLCHIVIGTGIELGAVQDALAQFLKLGEPLAVEDFLALLPNQPAVRWSPGPQL